MIDVLQASQTSSEHTDDDIDTAANSTKSNISLLEVLRRSPFTPSGGNLRERGAVSRTPEPLSRNDVLEQQISYQSPAATEFANPGASGMHTCKRRTASGHAGHTAAPSAMDCGLVAQGNTEPRSDDCATNSDEGESDDGAPRFNILRPRSAQPCFHVPRASAAPQGTGTRDVLCRPGVKQGAPRSPLKEFNLFLQAPALSPKAACGRVVTPDASQSKYVDEKMHMKAAFSSPASTGAAGVLLPAQTLQASDLGPGRSPPACLKGCGTTTAAAGQSNPIAARVTGDAELRTSIPSAGRGRSHTTSTSSSGDDDSDEEEDTAAVPRFNLLRRAHDGAPVPPLRQSRAGDITITTIRPVMANAFSDPSVGAGVTAGRGSVPGVTPLTPPPPLPPPPPPPPSAPTAPEGLVGLRRSRADGGDSGSGDSSPDQPLAEAAQHLILPQDARAAGCTLQNAAATVADMHSRETPPQAKRVAAATNTALADAPQSALRVHTTGFLRSGRQFSSINGATTPGAPPGKAATATAATSVPPTGLGSSSDELLARAIQAAHRRRRSTPAPLRSLFGDEDPDSEITLESFDVQQQQPQLRMAVGVVPCAGSDIGGCGNYGDMGEVSGVPQPQPPQPADQQWHSMGPHQSEISPVAVKAMAPSPFAPFGKPPEDVSPDGGFLPDEHDDWGQDGGHAPNGWQYGGTSMTAGGSGQLEEQDLWQPLQPPPHVVDQQPVQWQRPSVPHAPTPQLWPHVGFEHHQLSQQQQQQERQQAWRQQPVQQEQVPPTQQQQQQQQLLPQQRSSKQEQLTHVGPWHGQGQAAVPANKRHTGATTKAQQQNAAAAVGTHSIVSFLRRPQARSASATACAPLSAAISPFNGALPQKRPRLRLSGREPGSAAPMIRPMAAAAPVAVAATSTPKHVTIDLADGDEAAQLQRPAAPGMQRRVPTGATPVVVLLDDDEGVTVMDGGPDGRHISTVLPGAECFEHLEDKEEGLGTVGFVTRRCQLRQGVKRRHAVLLLDEEEDVEGKEGGGGGQEAAHEGGFQQSTATGNAAATATAADAAALQSQPLAQGVLHQAAGGRPETDLRRRLTSTATATAAFPEVQQRPWQTGPQAQDVGTCSYGAAAPTAPCGNGMQRHPLMHHVPQQEGLVVDEDDAIEDCSQDDQQLLRLPPAASRPCGNRGGCEGGWVGAGVARSSTAAGRYSVGDVGGVGVGVGGGTEALRRHSLPGPHRLPGHPPLYSSAGGTRGLTAGGIMHADYGAQPASGATGGSALPRPQQQALPLQTVTAAGQPPLRRPPPPQAQHHEQLPQQLAYPHQNQQETQQPQPQPQPHNHHRNHDYQQQVQQQPQQQQQAPWWTLLPDFVPAAALAGGYDPRPGPRPEPVFILYQKQFNGPANSSVAPMHENTLQQQQQPGGPSGSGAGPYGACDELLEWAQDLRGGKSRGGGSRPRRTSMTAGTSGGAAADAVGGTAGGSGRWYTNNNGVRVYVENGHEYMGRDAYNRYRRSSGAGVDGGTGPNNGSGRRKGRRKGGKGKKSGSRSSGARKKKTATKLGATGGVIKEKGKGKRFTAGTSVTTGMWLGKGK